MIRVALVQVVCHDDTVMPVLFEYPAIRKAVACTVAGPVELVELMLAVRERRANSVLLSLFISPLSTAWMYPVWK